MQSIKFINLNNSSKENINQFWNVFIQWMSTTKIRELYFTEEYKASTKEEFYTNIDFFNDEYIDYYFKEYPFLKIANSGVEEEQLKDFLKIAYNRWVIVDKREDFAAEVNEQLRKVGISSLISVNQSKIVNKEAEKEIFVDIKFVKDPMIRKELIIDLMQILSLMQGNNIYRGQKENKLNDVVRDGLKITRRYQIHDQSRHGESESGLDAGELDLLISTKDDDLPIAIVEALILGRMNKKNLSNHIDKALTKYDPNGCPITIIIIYSRCTDFSEQASKIEKYLDSYNYPYEVKDSFEEVCTGYTESRHWKLDLIRSNKDITVHILDFNLP